MLGESYLATGATMLQIEGEIHPAWIAGGNTVVVAGLILAHRFMDDTPRKKKEPSDKKPGGSRIAARLA